mmetsp:Transcript_34780/g.103976  ORF Transcript_34780/g.103976 Transcript_34780/m.103976 type:complete len:192 (-) Transcript_34780:36-611(-)
MCRISAPSGVLVGLSTSVKAKDPAGPVALGQGQAPGASPPELCGGLATTSPGMAAATGGPSSPPTIAVLPGAAAGAAPGGGAVGGGVGGRTGTTCRPKAVCCSAPGIGSALGATSGGPGCALQAAGGVCSGSELGDVDPGVLVPEPGLLPAPGVHVVAVPEALEEQRGVASALLVFGASFRRRGHPVGPLP